MRGDVNALLMDDGDWVEGAAAEFDFVRYSLPDINGIPRSKLIPRRPRRHVDEKLRTGVGVGGSKSVMKCNYMLDFTVCLWCFSCLLLFIYIIFTARC